MLPHWNNSVRVDKLLHSDTLSWFRVNTYVLLLLNAACLAEKQQIPILYSLGLKPTIYHTLGKHTNHYTIDVVQFDSKMYS